MAKRFNNPGNTVNDKYFNYSYDNNRVNSENKNCKVLQVLTKAEYQYQFSKFTKS